MNGNRLLLSITVITAISAMVFTSGCFHTGVSRDLWFPGEDDTITYRSWTIAEVRHNFTGAFTETSISLGAEERSLEVDNFHIGEGGADIYIYGQVHFGPDSQASIEFDRWVEISLIYEPGDENENIIPPTRYQTTGDSRYDRSELIATINGTRPGLYSLRATGVGTAVQNDDVPTYDWYWFTVSGRIPDGSYNNNAPDK